MEPITEQSRREAHATFSDPRRQTSITRDAHVAGFGAAASDEELFCDSGKSSRTVASSGRSEPEVCQSLQRLNGISYFPKWSNRFASIIKKGVMFLAELRSAALATGNRRFCHSGEEAFSSGVRERLMSATVAFDRRGPSLVASMGFRCEEFTRHGT